MRPSYRPAAALAVSLPVAFAQTSTDCNPTLKTCPADVGLNAASYSVDFTTGSGANASWSAASGTTITYGTQGAEFTISQAGEAPTLQTDFYFLFGRVDVKMRAAPGVGIVSSVVLESDDLDEIDWEWLGGNTAQVETNYFGKGNTTAYDRAIYYNVATPQSTFHTYTIDWTAARIEFLVDGTLVRTLAYSDAVGGQNYPQTPMRLKLGNWAGGGPGEPEGTVEWAGGNVTFSDGPFTMYVASVSITNNNPADSYEYGDMTGDWQSINIIAGNSSTATSSQTAAPTSSHSVDAVMQTAAAVSSTSTGSYSMSSASASGDDSITSTDISTDSAMTTTTVVTASTEVPNNSAIVTDSTSAGVTASASVATSSTNPAVQTSTAVAGAAKNIAAGGSLLGFALSLLVL